LPEWVGDERKITLYAEIRKAERGAGDQIFQLDVFYKDALVQTWESERDEEKDFTRS
jgi:hypothetical protein